MNLSVGDIINKKVIDKHIPRLVKDVKYNVYFQVHELKDNEKVKVVDTDGNRYTINLCDIKQQVTNKHTIGSFLNYKQNTNIHSCVILDAKISYRLFHLYVFDFTLDRKLKFIFDYYHDINLITNNEETIECVIVDNNSKPDTTPDWLYKKITSFGTPGGVPGILKRV